MILSVIGRHPSSFVQLSVYVRMYAQNCRSAGLAVTLSSQTIYTLWQTVILLWPLWHANMRYILLLLSFGFILVLTRPLSNKNCIPALSAIKK